jgi:putative methionine-R-sulfoxide reductase with GAF domain
MIAAKTLAAYLREQLLNLELDQVQVAALTLGMVLEVEKPAVAHDLFRFPVPRLGEEGACSLVDELAEEAYDLSVWFGGATPEAHAALRNLGALLESTNQQVGADWLGVYAVRGKGGEARLVKLSYLGRPSRAEFPLTEAFAAQSNNSRVGLSGWGAVIDDVAAWREQGGGYYTCDPAVQSEVCLPVLDEDGRVLGIIDAEAGDKAFFNPERLAWLAALATVLSEPLTQMPFADEESPSEG